MTAMHIGTVRQPGEGSEIAAHAPQIGSLPHESANASNFSSELDANLLSSSHRPSPPVASLGAAGSAASEAAAKPAAADKGWLGSLGTALKRQPGESAQAFGDRFDKSLKPLTVPLASLQQMMAMAGVGVGAASLYNAENGNPTPAAGTDGPGTADEVGIQPDNSPVA